MANAFSKEERVAFEDLLEGFQDALVLSRNVSVYNTDQTMMERTDNVIWRPIPYIAQSVTGTAGTDLSSSFKEYAQLSVPSQINVARAVPFTMNALELRDALQEGRLGTAAKQKLASDINSQIMTVASNEGTLVVKRTTAASGFDDVAQCDAIMNETGVPMEDRFLALSTRDYNGMAANIANGSSTAQRSFNGNKSATAYERAFVGNVAGFQTFKLDYANTLTKATSIVVDVNGANQYYTPAATTTSSNGLVKVNVDNRYQTINISVASGTVTAAIKVGDCFTIAGVNAVHQITKGDTGQLKTFRVIARANGAGSDGTLTISPPIISGGGSTDVELQYKNCTATPADNAVITFLNTAPATGGATINPFWHKSSLEILPGRYAVPGDAGVSVMRGTTDQGFELVMSKFYDINTMKTKYRVDTLFGVVNLAPEMSGIMLFSQT